MKFEKLLEDLLEKKTKPVKLGTVFSTQLAFKIIDTSTTPPKWKTIKKLDKPVVKNTDISKALKGLEKTYNVSRDVWIFWAHGEREMASTWLQTRAAGRN